MKRTAMISGLCLAATSLTFAPSPASAADFCADKISGPYHQHTFNYQGSPAATICADAHFNPGRAYLYARGQWANVSKYMKLSDTTEGEGTVTVDGNFFSYCYVTRPVGPSNTFHAVMFDGNGHKIVDGVDSDAD